MTTTPSRFASLLPKARAGMISALGRFPWVLLCGLAGTVAGVVSLENKPNDEVTSWCLKIAMTAALGMPLFFSLRILRERMTRLARWPWEIAGLPLLAGWFMMLPDRMADGSKIVVIRWFLLLASLHLFAAVSGYVRGGEENGMWQFNRRIFLRFCLATLYTGVLTAGLELALLSAEKLFGLDVGDAYGHLFFVILGCFHPVFFLAGVPRDFKALEQDTEHPRGLKVFTQFALAPLVAVYTAILYAYALKIIAAHTWPHGWVALPVLILSGVGIFSELLLHPLRTRPEEKWAGWFCRNFPRALAPLSLLLLLSVRERITAYGVTEERYLGIVAGGWILAWALLFAFKKTAGIRWVPASLAVICLLAAYGPWSAGTMSRNSQFGRVTQVLEKNGILVDGKIQVPENLKGLSSADTESLRKGLEYLIGTHGGETLHSFFGGVSKLKETDWKHLGQFDGAGQIMAQLNVAAGLSEEEIYPYVDYNADQTKGLNVEGFQRVFVFQNLYDSSWTGSKQEGAGLYFGFEDGVLKVTPSADEPPRPIPLEPLFNALPKKAPSPLPQEQMTVDWERNGRTFRIIFTNIYLQKKPNAPPHMQRCSFMLLEK